MFLLFRIFAILCKLFTNLLFFSFLLEKSFNYHILVWLDGDGESKIHPWSCICQEYKPFIYKLVLQLSRVLFLQFSRVISRIFQYFVFWIFYILFLKFSRICLLKLSKNFPRFYFWNFYEFHKILLNCLNWTNSIYSW